MQYTMYLVCSGPGDPIFGPAWPVPVTSQRRWAVGWEGVAAGVEVVGAAGCGDAVAHAVVATRTRVASVPAMVVRVVMALPSGRRGCRVVERGEGRPGDSRPALVRARGSCSRQLPVFVWASGSAGRVGEHGVLRVQPVRERGAPGPREQVVCGRVPALDLAEQIPRSEGRDLHAPDISERLTPPVAVGADAVERLLGG